MDIDFANDQNVMVKLRISSEVMMSPSFDQRDFWERMKHRLNEQFFYEVFPQMFNSEWHCIKMQYVQRPYVDDWGSVEFAIIGKLIAVREAVREMWPDTETEVVYKGNGREETYFLTCSHCGCQWTPTAKGACSSCGVDARAALNLVLPEKNHGR